MLRYYITDRKSAGGFPALLESIRDQMNIGIDFIQIREKDLPTRAVYEWTRAVLEARDSLPKGVTHPKILVNTRADIAIAAQADGVHLPSDAPAETLPGLLVFRSCHTLAEVRDCEADFVTFGPVFSSPGKGIPVGISLLTQACQLGKQVLALGGVHWDNADQCVAAGAAGIAGIRLFQNPED